MRVLLILNDPPYGTERTYNGLRLALALVKLPDTEVTVFLMADAVGAARRGQKTPEGHYNLERMVRRIAMAPHRVLSCGSCLDARGLGEGDLVDGVVRSTMEELARETAAADNVVTF